MNVKPGNMAKLIHAEIPEAIGLIVEVKTLASFWEHFRVPSKGILWDCTAVSGAKAYTGENNPSYAMPGDACVIPDKWLKRIDPKPDDTADTHTTEREVATS